MNRKGLGDRSVSVTVEESEAGAQQDLDQMADRGSAAGPMIPGQIAITHLKSEVDADHELDQSSARVLLLVRVGIQRLRREWRRAEAALVAEQGQLSDRAMLLSA